MRIPTRRSEKNAQHSADPYITQNKADELKKELERLIKFVRPKLADEVAELAKLGDFSENAAYQMAKGKLRGLNNRIMALDDMLSHAIIIDQGAADGIVHIGSKVTVDINDSQKILQILGSEETNPSQGIISHLSPIGSALIGHKVNDTVEMEINDRKIIYKILKVE